MELAKGHIDIGIFTNTEAEMLRFWQQEVGAAFEETLALGGGVRQQRHGMHGSVIKINSAREPIESGGASGYQELLIAAEIDSYRSLVDPDGNTVTLVPRSEGWIEGIAVRLGVRDEAAHRRFFGETLGLEPIGSNGYRCGDSILLFDEDPEAARAGEMAGIGFRYLTIQVRDCDREHAGLLARGAEEGRPPVTLGSVARISFIRDPDGNWIEISQRGSLTGALPP